MAVLGVQPGDAARPRTDVARIPHRHREIGDNAYRYRDP